MRFVDFEAVRARLRGKSVAVVGSAPSCANNEPRFIDAHEVVVRVNNFKLGGGLGKRCDVHHSFYGSSIKPSAEFLAACGVTLCMCKCPDGKPLESEWHERNGKTNGIDYTYIYRSRRNWWFCDTFVPTAEHFLVPFNLLAQHQPTSGFAAIYDVLRCEPRSVYLTGFDFFISGMHNVNERWNGREKNLDDPIRHRPDLEAAWLFEHTTRYPLLFDAKLRELQAQASRSARQARTAAERAQE